MLVIAKPTNYWCKKY